MRRLAPADILDLVESCAGLATRALAILARAEPDAADTHRSLTVGARDVRLMAVRIQTFGPRVELVSLCPACAASVEFAISAADVGLDAEPPLQGGTVRRIQGREIVLRPITAGDLAAIEPLADVEAARRELLARCVLAVDGEPAGEAGADLGADVEGALEELDPQADVLLVVDCPACGVSWTEAFDPALVLAADIRLAGRRLMSDVAALARSYHWSERDILALSPARRAFYLEAAG